jgi:phytol kinase
VTLLEQKLFDFFVENMPSLQLVVLGGPFGFLLAFGALYLAGWLKREKGWKTGYSRKMFHFTVFGTVAVLHSISGTKAVCLFGAMTSLVVFLAVILGEGNILYEAMAREKDAPRRTWFIIVPYFATLIGGIMSNVLFGQAAVAGYLVAGLGDAVGEPVGTMFGRHTYEVPSFGGIKSRRSLEGSAAVLLVSILAVAAVIFILCPWKSLSVFLTAAVVIGTVSALIEAFSPHGWDNTTMQIAPSFLVWVLAGRI